MPRLQERGFSVESSLYVVHYKTLAVKYAEKELDQYEDNILG